MMRALIRFCGFSVSKLRLECFCYNLFMENIFLKTKRITLRYITQNDFEELKKILQDKDVMYAWEYNFSDEDVQNWINQNLDRYKKYNLGFFLIVENSSGTILGQAALMPDFINEHKYYEIGYILKKEYWHQGFASEAVKALIHYAFNTLNLKEVIFEIRPENSPSRKVAENFNAVICGDFVKNVRGKKMVHLIYKLNG